MSQWSAIAALKSPKEIIESMVMVYSKRRDIMVERINAIEGIRCRKPDGAFYVFASIEGLLGRRWEKGIIQNDLDVAEFFLEKAHVAVVPGSASEYQNYVRFVFAKSEADINKGFDRIREAVSQI